MKIVWRPRPGHRTRRLRGTAGASQDRLHDGDDDDEAFSKRRSILKKTQGENALTFTGPRSRQTVGGSAWSATFVNRVFNGSAEPLLVHLAENELTPEELDEVRALLKEKKR